MLRIEAPAAQPEKGGLLAQVTPKTDIEGFAFLYGVTFESVLAGTPQPIPSPDQDKEFGRLTTKEFSPFTVYAGITANIMDDEETARDRLADAFEGNLSKALESGIQRTLLNPNSEVLHSGAAITNPRLALGLLEQWASENVGTLAMVHTNKLGAAMLRDLKGDDGVLRTKQGNLLANGGGYTSTGPGGTQAASGQAWVYVSRVPTIYRTETQVTDGRELKANDYHALAEASFVPIIEGQAAAVLLEG